MVVLFTFTDKRDFYKNKFFMVQTINTTHNISDESDGLPMPKRIWAVVSVGFALWHVCTGHQYSQYRIAYAFARLRDNACRDDMDYQRVSVGNRYFTVVFLRFGGDDRLPEGVSFGHRIVLYHFADLCAVRFVLDADGGTYFSRVQRFSYYKCEYGAVTVYLPEKSDWPRDGN